MTIKEQIMEIIENYSNIKEISEDNKECFKNIVLPAINNAKEEDVLYTVIMMLITQTAIYDSILNNIAQFGSRELIEKCNKDINNIIQD